MIEWEFAAPVRSERLELRLVTLDDIDAVHSWMSDPEVARYQLYEPRTREVVAEKVAETVGATRLASVNDFVQPVIVLDGEVIGSIYFTIASVENLTGEIGWALRREFWGHGYAAEAASAMLDVAFRDVGLHRVFAELDPRNAASVALCLRLGMRHEATFLEHMMFKGAWADTGIYAILDHEWKARA